MRAPAVDAHGRSTGFQLIAPALPRSSASSAATSAASSAKSYTCAFDRMRAGVDDLGSGTYLARARQRARTGGARDGRGRTLSGATSG